MSIKTGRAAASAQATPRPVDGTLRPVVYIVEPNPFMAEMERAILKPFEVRFVLPGELIGAVLKFPPSLVITEILLSGIDGLQLCRELKARPETSSVPVLVFSILDASEEAADAGADSFLLKPAERNALLSEARRLVDWPPKADQC